MTLQDRIREVLDENVFEFDDSKDELRFRYRGQQLDFVVAELMAALESKCVCNVGVQECSEHPGRLTDKEKNIAFRKAWDARVLEK